jgi:hypothetical protein
LFSKNDSEIEVGMTIEKEEEKKTQTKKTSRKKLRKTKKCVCVQFKIKDE